MRTRSGLSYQNQHPVVLSQQKRVVQSSRNCQTPCSRSYSRILLRYFTFKRVAPLQRKSFIDERLQKFKTPTGYPPGVICGFVFVGHINPSTTETDVQEFFEGCGPIRSVQISCGQGQGTTVGMAIPKPVRRTRDSQHAFVVFEERASVFKALECNGRRLRNWPVSISVRAQDVAPGVPKPRVVKPPRKR